MTTPNHIPNTITTVKNDEDAVHDTFRISNLTEPVEDASHEIEAKDIFSEEEAQGWVIVYKSDIQEDSPLVKTKRQRIEPTQSNSDDREENNAIDTAMKTTMKTAMTIYKEMAEAEKEYVKRIAKYEEQMREASEKASKDNDILHKANEILRRSAESMRKKSLKEQQILLFLRQEISTEQEKLLDVRRQRIEEEMRRDNALKIFDYVKTTIGIAHTGFHQIPHEY
tara:strand:+ start:299 stop:973 length:675 start_codon:yes stop_codon:yes gene_type:complete